MFASAPNVSGGLFDDDDDDELFSTPAKSTPQAKKVKDTTEKKNNDLRYWDFSAHQFMFQTESVCTF